MGVRRTQMRISAPTTLLCLRVWGSPTFPLDKINSSIRDLSIIISGPTNKKKNNLGRERQASACSISARLLGPKDPRRGVPSTVPSACLDPPVWFPNKKVNKNKFF